MRELYRVYPKDKAPVQFREMIVLAKGTTEALDIYLYAESLHCVLRRQFKAELVDEDEASVFEGTIWFKEDNGMYGRQAYMGSLLAEILAGENSEMPDFIEEEAVAEEEEEDDQTV